MKLNQGTAQPPIQGQFGIEQCRFSYPNGFQAYTYQYDIQPNKITALVWFIWRW